MSFVEEFSILKYAGAFAIVIVLLSWGLQILIAGNLWVRTGDVKPLLQASGGKVLSIDVRLKEDIHLIKNPQLISLNSDSLLKDRELYLLLDDLVFNLAILVLAGLMLFKFILWMSGSRQWEVSVQVLAVVLILGTFAILEILYSYYLTHTVVYPLSGIIGGEDSLTMFVWQLFNDPTLASRVMGSIQNQYVPAQSLNISVSNITGNLTVGGA